MEELSKPKLSQQCLGCFIFLFKFIMNICSQKPIVIDNNHSITTHVKTPFLNFTWKFIFRYNSNRTYNDLHFFKAHGTFIGRIRLESKKPQQVPIDSEIHFGASTRIYIIRERPQPISGQLNDEKDKHGEELEGSLLGLPETETELDVS